MKGKLNILVLEPTEYVNSAIEHFYGEILKTCGYEYVFIFLKNPIDVIKKTKNDTSVFKKHEIDLFICELNLNKQTAEDNSGLIIIEKIKTDFPDLFVICNSWSMLSLADVQQFHPSFDIFADKTKFLNSKYKKYISDLVKIKFSLQMDASKKNNLFRKVFISYAKEDYDYANKLYNFLESNSFEPWLDKRKLLVGENWDFKIKKALKESDFIILLLSSTSVKKRGYVQREYRSALDYWEQRLDDDIYIIPVLIDNCTVPDNLTRFQWINYDEKDAFSNILNSLSLQRTIYLGSK